MWLPVILTLGAVVATTGFWLLNWRDASRSMQTGACRPRITTMEYEISYTDRLGRPAKALVKASSPERARLRFVSQNLGLEVTGVELIPND